MTKIIHYDFKGNANRAIEINELTEIALAEYDKIKEKYPNLKVEEMDKLPEVQALNPILVQIDKLYEEMFFWNEKGGNKWVELL